MGVASWSWRVQGEWPVTAARYPSDSPCQATNCMRLNPFKNIRLSFQLFTLVVMSFAIASGLIYYAMQQVRSTQDTLKHTIDNRMHCP